MLLLNHQTYKCVILSNSPLNQFYSDKIIAISRVEKYEAIWRGGLKLEEEVHGCVGLKGGQAQIAALGFKCDRVCNNGTDPKAGVELTIVNVTIFAQVDVEHAIKSAKRKGKGTCTCSSKEEKFG